MDEEQTLMYALEAVNIADLVNFRFMTSFRENFWKCDIISISDAVTWSERSGVGGLRGDVDRRAAYRALRGFAAGASQCGRLCDRPLVQYWWVTVVLLAGLVGYRILNQKSSFSSFSLWLTVFMWMDYRSFSFSLENCFWRSCSDLRSAASYQSTISQEF